MAKRSAEYTVYELATMSREELDALWMEVREELEQHEMEDLRQYDPAAYGALGLALFYTLSKDELFAQYAVEKKRIEAIAEDERDENDIRRLDYINQWIN